MEKRISVTNHTKMPIYVGSYMVPPGETRDFPESQVPPHLRPADEPATVAVPDDPIAEFLKQPVKEILPHLASLTGEQLDALEAAEKNAEKPRSTLLGKITEERIARAMAEDQAAAEMQSWVESLTALNDEELQLAIEAHGNDAGRLELIQEEINRRHAGEQSNGTV